MEKNKIIFLANKFKYHILSFLLFGFFFFVIINKKLEKADLQKNGEIINVKIIEYIPPGKGGFMANYRCRFNFNNKLLTGISESSIESKKYFYIGKEFPALYSVKYDAVRLLMTPKDFEEFNRPFPDSLYKKIDKDSY